MRISVHSEWDEFARTLTRFQREQLPFATARALTATARAVGQDVTKSLGEVFDRPTPFTQRAVFTTSASKTKLEATIGLRPVQAEYLKLQETGGKRSPKKTALVLPVGQRVNQYGNLPARALARLKARKDVFIGKVGGRGGVWQRKPQGHVKLLIAFRSGAKYEKRFGYWDRVTRDVRAAFATAIPLALKQAMETARR